MKRENNFLDRLKICFNYLKTADINQGLIEMCPYCNSIDIKKVSSEDIMISDKATHKAYYVCCKCGAEAKVNELWDRKK